MKRHLILIFSLLLLLPLQAQEFVEVENREFLFFNELTSPKPEQGNVRLFKDPRLTHMIAEKAEENRRRSHRDFILMNGYRVQVFAGNAPRTSRDEAFRLEAAVREVIPDTEVYITFTSPFWRVRVGDSRTYQEAIVLLNSLRRHFPRERNNFYIVREVVRVAVN